MEVSLRFKKDKDLLTSPKENLYLVRVPEKEGESLRWRDEWLEPPPLEKVEFVTKPIDDVRLQRIKNIVSRQQRIWEVDFFYFPGAVEEGERPYYPYAFLCVDHHSGLVLNTDLASPLEYRSEFQKQFLNFVENIKFLPKEVLVRKEEAFKLLEPITSGLEVKLRLVKTLEALEEARTSMFDFFTRR